jgi:hypothetical protein
MCSPEVSKHFFFEKKKQKTFAELDLGRWDARGPVQQKFFAALFFKKARTYCPHNPTNDSR